MSSSMRAQNDHMQAQMPASIRVSSFEYGHYRTFGDIVHLRERYRSLLYRLLTIVQWDLDSLPSCEASLTLETVN
jgi:hypothetical protein